MDTLITWQDAIDHLYLYTGGGPADTVLATLRKAVDSAYRTVYSAHNWTYYYKHGRINTVAPFSSGTITYDYAGKLLTLSGDVFPPWAADGQIRIGSAVYLPDAFVSDTVLRMNAALSPEQVISEDTPYMLFKDSYLLPQDFTAGDNGVIESSFADLEYTHPRDWLYDLSQSTSVGSPRGYTITGDERSPGRLFLRLFPAPDAAKEINYIYRRKPRQLSVASVAGTGMSFSGDTLTATSAVFTSAMVGSVIRLGTGGVPTDKFGARPPIYEGIIAAVYDPVTAGVKTPTGESYAASAYIISDPIDIEPESMTDVFLRCCESKISITRIMKDKPDARLQYQEELILAKERDSRSFARRSAGDSLCVQPRIRKDYSFPAEYP